MGAVNEKLNWNDQAANKSVSLSECFVLFMQYSIFHLPIKDKSLALKNMDGIGKNV